MTAPAAVRTAASLALLAALTATPATAWPRLCLPPVFENGQRLHQLPAPNAFWLQLLLRQHELCWYRPTHPHEQRIALFGNSAVYSLPLPAEQALAGQLNQHFIEHDLAARTFNLAWICPDQVRDAVVLHAALPYRLDIVVFALTLDDFGHVAPVLYPPALVEFFRRNPDASAPMVADPPAGLAEPMARYGRWLARVAATADPFDRLREVGRLARIAARQQARSLARRLHLTLSEPPLKTPSRVSPDR